MGDRGMLFLNPGKKGVGLVSGRMVIIWGQDFFITIGTPNWEGFKGGLFGLTLVMGKGQPGTFRPFGQWIYQGWENLGF